MRKNSKKEEITIGNRLKQLRLTQGKKQDEVVKELIEQLGYRSFNRQTLSAFENDRKELKAGTIKIFAKYYNVSCDYLLFGTAPTITEERLVESKKETEDKLNEITLDYVNGDPTSVNFIDFLVQYHNKDGVHLFSKLTKLLQDIQNLKILYDNYIVRFNDNDICNYCIRELNNKKDITIKLNNKLFNPKKEYIEEIKKELQISKDYLNEIQAKQLQVNQIISELMESYLNCKQVGVSGYPYKNKQFLGYLDSRENNKRTENLFKENIAKLKEFYNSIKEDYSISIFADFDIDKLIEEYLKK